MAYLVSALMSLAFIVVPMHGLIWGIDRVFKYIGFYAVGVFIAGKSVKAVRKKVEAGIVAIVPVIKIEETKEYNISPSNKLQNQVNNNKLHLSLIHI